MKEIIIDINPKDETHCGDCNFCAPQEDFELGETSYWCALMMACAPGDDGCLDDPDGGDPLRKQWCIENAEDATC